MTILFVLPLLARAAAAPVLAAGGATIPRDVFLPPSGLWLLASDHSGRLYGPTSAAANWKVAQWEIPADLPPLNANGVSTNKFASAEFHRGGTIALAQNLSDIPCTQVFPSGRTLVHEFDLLAGPNKHGRAGKAPAADGDDAEPLTHTACSNNRMNVIEAVVLTNPASRQTLFYQLRLATLAGASGEHRNAPVAPNWFFAGQNIQTGASGQFGFGDNPTTFSVRFTEPGGSTNYKLDLLPRLKQLIAEGARFGVAQDLSQWRITGAYEGLGSWGHVRGSAELSNYSLRVERIAAGAPHAR
jgi:hypothetical protein